MTANRRRFSPLGVLLALLAFVLFPLLISHVLESWALGIPAGLVIAILACEPARCGGAWIWHQEGKG